MKNELYLFMDKELEGEDAVNWHHVSMCSQNVRERFFWRMEKICCIIESIWERLC